MRVLQLIRVDGVGGAEKVLLNGIPALREAGIDVVLGLLDPCAEGRNPILPHLRKEQIPWIRLPDAGRFSPLRIRSFLSRIKREKIALLHIHGYRAAMYGVPLARLGGLPVVSTRHGLLSRNAKERFVESLELAITNVMDAAICVAPHLAKGVRTRAVLIPNAIPIPSDESIFLPSEPIGRGLFVGRLSQEKNPGTLIDLWEKLSRRFPSLQLDIVGDGPLLPSLKEDVTKRGLAKQIHFHGFVSPEGFYRKADFFLLPSLREGLPLVVLEAMAAQIPVIASAVGALPQLLQQDPPIGLLVPPDDLNSLYGACMRLLENPTLARSFGVKGREYVISNHSLSQWASQHIELYRRLICYEKS